MTGEVPSLVRVVTDYNAAFTDPIRVNTGDRVTLDPAKKTDIPGWVWCTNRLGKSGWIPAAYLEGQGRSGRICCDYDAIELTIHVGDLLTVHKMESGFYWVADRLGQMGWVPVTHVEPCHPQGSEEQ